MPWGVKKRLFVYDWHHDALQSFAPLAHLPYSFFFDSARGGHPLNRYSYICWDPFETIESKDGRVSVSNDTMQDSYKADPFQVVRERIAFYAENRKTRKDLPPFHGGAAGYFGYGLAHGMEKISARKDDSSQKDMCVGLYDKVIAFDHEKHSACLMVHAEDESKAAAVKDALESMIAQARPITPYRDAPMFWKSEKSDKEYKKDIARVIEYIYAGDIFQANLSRRFDAALPYGFDAFSHYAHLREINAAPYCAYLNFNDVKLVSTSPERFLEVRGKIVETRPIKGTLPSSLPASALKDSDKDCAENVMIVDLLRNDLSKVCDDHSIEVSSLCEVETFEGLHHLVSIVRGKLRGDQGAMDALRACFPGGSITGAPKIRAMQIIDELEPQPRGAYCGAIGYAGFDGAMDTAITIRTLVYRDRTVSLQTGGGITAQSDPQKELEETLTKAQKIFESFGDRRGLKRTA